MSDCDYRDDELGEFMPLPREARYTPAWDGVERRTLIRRRADPAMVGVLRGEVDPMMGRVVDVTDILSRG